jgi:hypothetical protein
MMILQKKDAEASQTESGSFGTLRYALTPIPYASPRGLLGGSRAMP